MWGGFKRTLIWCIINGTLNVAPGRWYSLAFEPHIDLILPKEPYLPCVTMASRALLRDTIDMKVSFSFITYHIIHNFSGPNQCVSQMVHHLFYEISHSRWLRDWNSCESVPAVIRRVLITHSLDNAANALLSKAICLPHLVIIGDPTCLRVLLGCHMITLIDSFK